MRYNEQPEAGHACFVSCVTHFDLRLKHIFFVPVSFQFFPQSAACMCVCVSVFTLQGAAVSISNILRVFP